MAFEKTPYTFDRVFRMALTICFVLISLWLVNYLSDVLLPFAIALLLAYIINPLVLFYMRFLKKRSYSLVSALLSVAIVLGVFFKLIIPVFVNEISNTGEILSKFVDSSHLEENAKNAIPESVYKYVEVYITSDKVRDFFTVENFSEYFQKAVNVVMPGVNNVMSGVSTIIGLLVGSFIVLLYLIFILADYDSFMEKWKKYIPLSYRDKVLKVIKDFDVGMNNYFRKQALIAVILGVLYAVGFAIIGLPMGIFLGLLMSILVMVPYLQVLGMIPAALLGVVYSIETGEMLWIVLVKISVVFFIIEIVNDGFLVPKIMGKLTGLKPAIILLSISIWGKLLGFLGLIIALPLTVLLIAYYEQFLAKKKEL